MTSCTKNYCTNKKNRRQRIANYLSLTTNKVLKKMKQLLSLFILVSVVFTSCKKEDKCPYSESGVTASVTERDYLRNYVTSNNITATEHPSGVFYNITTAGVGESPSVCSNVTVRYTGSLIPGGTVFDTNAGTSGSNFTLGQLIGGWQKVLPLLKRGGLITLYIPPSLGYGQQNVRDQNQNIIIPGNSYLKFEIELINVQ
jgi:FKBP-type peptidyl-prolyl cis-trans isomerase FkpA